MYRTISSTFFGVAVALLVALDVSAVAAQTTFRACRVPDVGAIYMIGVAGAPTACLDASHVEFSWSEGGATVADGSITTVKLAAGAVTPPKVSFNYAASGSKGGTALDSDKVDGFDATDLLPGGTLPAGSTIRGFFGSGWQAAGVGAFNETYIAFGYSLASAPTAHYIERGTAPPAGCPGTSVDPQADPGHLCVYEDNTGNASSRSVCSSSNCPGATPWGAQLRGMSVGAGSAWMRGTWAVTAP